MTPLAALALAIRDRLVAGAPAPLLGLGTLGRAHVSARVHTDADGRRVLLPPGEAVGLSTRAYDPADLTAALARRAGVTEGAAADLLREAVDQIEARLAITGDVRIDGVGAFQRTSGGIRFAPAPEILAAVNRPFEGLAPVGIAPPEAPPAPAAPTPRPPAVPSPPVPHEPPGAVDILLDLIVNEPSEPAEAEIATPAGAPHPADVSPAESAFADDSPLADAAAIAPFAAPEAPTVAETQEEPEAPTEMLEDEAPAESPEAVGDADEADEADPLDPIDDGFAVPFGADGASLRDLLPPTETDWHPAPLPDGDVLDAIPHSLVEDAEVLTPAVAPPSLPDAHALPEPADAGSDAAPHEEPASAEPVPTEPAPTESAPAARSARPLWPALYGLLVLALSSLIVWWAVSEQHPRILPARPGAPALPADAPR